MIPLDLAMPPFFDLGVDLLVQVRHRARRHPRAPQRLGDVLDPAHRHPSQIHLDQSLLDRTLPALIPLDDRRIKSLTPELRHLQLHLSGLGVQRPLITPSPRVLAILDAFISRRTAQAIRLRVQ